MSAKVFKEYSQQCSWHQNYAVIWVSTNSKTLLCNVNSNENKNRKSASLNRGRNSWSSKLIPLREGTENDPTVQIRNRKWNCSFSTWFLIQRKKPLKVIINDFSCYEVFHFEHWKQCDCEKRANIFSRKRRQRYFYL